MDFLEYLKQDPKCLYLYNWGPYIYGLSKKCTKYFAIVDDKGVLSEDGVGLIQKTTTSDCGQTFVKDDITVYVFYISYGFDLILRGNLMCGECACMNKKYILKEHVKLMMHTDIVQLRKGIDRQKDKLLMSTDNTSFDIGSGIKNCKFVNQIIDNHKIVNFKEANAEYYQLTNGEVDISNLENFLLEQPCYKLLKERTDEQLRQSKIRKILQSHK